MSLHGISKDAWKRYTAAGSWYYEITGSRLQVQHVRHHGRASAWRSSARWTPCASAGRRLRTSTTPRLPVIPELEAAHGSRARRSCVAPLYASPASGLSIGRDEFIEVPEAGEHRDERALHSASRASVLQDDVRVSTPKICRSRFANISAKSRLPIYSKMTDFDVRSVIDAVANVVEQFRTTRRYAVAGH